MMLTIKSNFESDDDGCDAGSQFDDDDINGACPIGHCSHTSFRRFVWFTRHYIR